MSEEMNIPVETEWGWRIAEVWGEEGKKKSGYPLMLPHTASHIHAPSSCFHICKDS
jgi:hypothetical protein